jgi:hypothetical protein
VNTILSAVEYLASRGFTCNPHNDGWFDRGRQTVRLCPDGVRIDYWGNTYQPTRRVSYEALPAVVR